MVSSPWSSIVQGSPVMLSDASVSVAPAPMISSSVEEQIGNFTSDWCPPTTVPEIASSPDDSSTDDSGTDGQGSDERRDERETEKRGEKKGKMGRIAALNG